VFSVLSQLKIHRVIILFLLLLMLLLMLLLLLLLFACSVVYYPPFHPMGKGVFVCHVVLIVFVVVDHSSDGPHHLMNKKLGERGG
jgi:peptidoglycan/LPS O-acetylase OafA/YrhL